ncbi:MAG TPA: HAD-IB family phosphatase [Methylomirabilota bacterium]|nr:HAD-IB family phosphatase [Methylomirabilota bacterium]
MEEAIRNEVNEQVTVIIPALNESATIASIVSFALRSPRVGEVIVVDDGSIDGTPELAANAGAQVITSTMLGKGRSMEDGVRMAAFETVLFLDGDLRGLREDLVEAICEPIFKNHADMVKAKFTREGGRVTALTARPLLRTYFPELSHLDQPLSGIMAARRSLLARLTFEDDYGVDVGLLIDAACAGARVVQVDIGHLAHESQNLEALGEMATQVARAVLQRAGAAGRLRSSFVREIREKERLRKAHRLFNMETIKPAEKLALFDMDGTLLGGRFIVELAKATGRMKALGALLDNEALSAELRSQRISQVFAGVPKETFQAVARAIPLTPAAAEAVIGLRKAGYRVGVVTDSYHIVAEIVRRRVFADFSFAHLMHFQRDKATGRVTLCPTTFGDGCHEHHHCKLNVLEQLKARFGIAPENTIAVGDGTNDICMLKAAGMSFAYQPNAPAVAAAAQYVITGRLDEILNYVNLTHPLCPPGLEEGEANDLVLRRELLRSSREEEISPEMM